MDMPQPLVAQKLGDYVTGPTGTGRSPWSRSFWAQPWPRAFPKVVVLAWP